MSAGVLTSERRATGRWTVRGLSLDIAGLSAWVLPFASILYLALEGGGYDTVVRSQVGIVLWWIVLIGALAGVLPAVSSRRGWAAIGLLLALAIWTALSLDWTESSERTVVEIGRVAVLLGALVLGLSVAGRGRQRQVIGGLATATALVAALAVLSRLRPGWFPANATAAGLNDFKRLSYPLNYWNGLAAFVAMGLPAMLSIASGARSLIARSLAAAAMPVMGLCVFLTVSRGGLAAVAVGLLVFIAVAPDRLPKLGTLAVAAAGTGVLFAAMADRTALRDGVSSSVAHGQANELLGVIALTVLAVGALQYAIGLMDRHAERLGWMAVSRRRAAAIATGSVVLAVVVSVAAGVPGAVSDGWEKFKNPHVATTVKDDSTFSRLATLSGRGRYQFWQAASAEQQTKPWQGTGAGTFEYWWSRHPIQNRGFVRDAHSLYMQMFGELGIVGLVLVLAFVLWLLIGGLARCLTVRDELRLPVAAATAGVAAFAAEASIDWIWQVTVIPVALMFLAAVVFAGDGSRTTARPTRRSRGVAMAGAVLCLPVIAVALAGSSAVADSQAAAKRGDLGSALGYARTAARAQPYAATPRMQEALVLEAGHDLNAAAAAAAGATDREPTNWRTWLIRSRIEAERGNAREAVGFFRRARSLNSQSTIFARGK